MTFPETHVLNTRRGWDAIAAFAQTIFAYRRPARTGARQGKGARHRQRLPRPRDRYGSAELTARRTSVLIERVIFDMDGAVDSESGGRGSIDLRRGEWRQWTGGDQP